MASLWPLLLTLLILSVKTCTSQNITASFLPSSIQLVIGSAQNVSLSFSLPLRYAVNFTVDYSSGDKSPSYNQSRDIVVPIGDFSLPSGSNGTVIQLTGGNVGVITIGVNASSADLIRLQDAYVRVHVVHNQPLEIVIAIIGWIYFVLWSISFYPQVFINFKRKSVIGLNFDFLAYNLTGFIVYSVFNVGLYGIPSIQDEYFADHSRGVNPVQVNDVVFAVHAVTLTLITIFQCIIYERGGQRLSRVSALILVLVFLFAFISVFLAVGRVITWLRFLYFFSYIKLFITLIKYMPQVWMNYKRQSTEGWSIGNILLDFSGGSFSLLQMFLMSYNNDDWGSIFGNPTKFGLGAFSIMFDIIFVVQHYILYREKDGYLPINKSPSV